MLEILTSTESFAYLDDAAVEALALARSAYQTFGFGLSPFYTSGPDLYVGHWAGARTGRTVALALQQTGLSVEDDGPFICISNADVTRTLDGICSALELLASEVVTHLANEVPSVIEEKFEVCLQSDRSLLERAWSARWLDLDGAAGVLKRWSEHYRTLGLDRTNE